MNSITTGDNNDSNININNNSNINSNNNSKNKVNAVNQHFASKNYERAVDGLNRLKKGNPNSLKIQHNITVCEYFLSGCSEPTRAIEELGKIRKEIDDKYQKPELNNNEAETVSDDDGTLVAYNQAVLFYQTKQHASAIKILEGLFRSIEPIEEALAVRISIILAQLYLNMCLPEKALAVLTYFDKIFPQLFSVHKQVGENTENVVTSNILELDLPKVLPPISKEEVVFLVHLLKAQIYLSSSKKDNTLKNAETEIEQVLLTGEKVVPHQINNINLFLRAQLEYIKQDYKKSLDLLMLTKPSHVISYPSSNTAIGLDFSIENSLSSLFFSNLGCIQHYLGKHNIAAFYFSRALKENELLYCDQDQNESGSSKSGVNGKKISASQYSLDRKPEILYNTGMQLLISGKPDLAFQFFQEVSLSYYKSPGVWYRMAECCVAVNVMKSKEEPNIDSKYPLVSKVVGEGESRRLILPTFGSHKGLQEREIDDSLTQLASEDSEEGIGLLRTGLISLEFAAKCLRNTLFLLTRSPPIKIETENENNSELINLDTLFTTTSPHTIKPIITSSTTWLFLLTPAEQELRLAALIYLAYVSLAGNNPYVALSSSLEILSTLKNSNNSLDNSSSPSSSNNNNNNSNHVFNSYRYLSHLFAAEALCMIGRPQLAMHYLTETLTDQWLISAQDSSGSETNNSHTTPSVYCAGNLWTDRMLINDPKFMKGVIYLNLTVANILSNDLSTAENYLSQALLLLENNPQALLTQVYLELRQGRLDNALHILKRSRPFPKRKD